MPALNFSGTGSLGTSSKMEKVVWTEACSVNHPAMDSQHKKIIAMINELIDHQCLGADPEFIADQISEMTRYCLDHLAEEEALLLKRGYVNFDDHQALHNEFRGKVVQICTATMLGIEVQSVMLEYLAEWWRHHICIEDMDYRDSV